MLGYNTIVDVNVNVNSPQIEVGTFDVGLILTPDADFTAEKRLMTFTSASEAVAGLIAAGFTSQDYVYGHAVAYFAANPAPHKLLVSCYPATGATDPVETPAEAILKVLDITHDFYGVCLAGVSDDNPILELQATIEASDHPMMLFIPIPNPPDYAVDPIRMMYKLNERNAKRAVCTYSNLPSWAAAVMGTVMGFVTAKQDGSFAMCYKTINGIQTTNLTQDEVDSIQELNGNVYVARGLSHKVFEKGTTSSGLRIEEVLYIDMIVNDLQNALLDLILNTNYKLPQTDSTTGMFISECNRTLENYYNRGILATSTWRGSGIKSVARGDAIEHGYVCMADSFNDQDQADRLAHKAMPITILLCLSGSVESIAITLNVQQ